jgi:hypothetical protein
MIMYKTARVKKKYFPVVLAALILLLILTRCVAESGRRLPRAENAADIAAYLATFGWQVEAEPVTVKNVQIPARFTEVYEQYNALQKRQGFDLSRYRADIVESYTFRVVNHPAAGDVFANVLVFKGRIIGGDICSFALNGFMTGFSGQPFA